MLKDNYEIRRDEAQKYFLSFDQEEIIHRWNLNADDAYIYVTFLHQRYRIDRRCGRVTYSADGFITMEEAGFEEVLSIFDLLCHAKTPPKALENWSVVNSLKGHPQTVGVQETRSGKEADLFDQDVDKYRNVCRSLGGTEVSMGDVGFEFVVFQNLKVRLKFYRADEEFAAQVVLLWPENALEYMYYETTFYVLRFLLKSIEKGMKE